MTYPLSSEVTAGQPTAVTDYNNLRRDALRLGNADADSLNLAGFLNRHFEHMNLVYLATNRLRVPYQINQPPTLMINGCLLQATANVDLPTGQFTGVACTWYIFAVRTPGSTTFTLSVNTAAAEATDQRLIGECYWDGSSITQTTIRCYFVPVLALSAADYDSGWFAVAFNNVYTKAHGLGYVPRMVLLYHAADSAGATEWVMVATIQDNTGLVKGNIGWDAVSVYLNTGTSSSYGAAVFSMRRNSNGGYYRIFAWK
jgi:hypothetical protein